MSLQSSTQGTAPHVRTSCTLSGLRNPAPDQATLARLLEGATALLRRRRLIGGEAAPDWKNKAAAFVSGGQAGEHQVAHVPAMGLPIFAQEAARLVFGVDVGTLERFYAQARRRSGTGRLHVEEMESFTFNIQRQVVREKQTGRIQSNFSA